MLFLKEAKTVGNRARNHLGNILATHLAAFCLYPENLSEVEFKGNN